MQSCGNPTVSLNRLNPDGKNTYIHSCMNANDVTDVTLNRPHFTVRCFM